MKLKDLLISMLTAFGVSDEIIDAVKSDDEAKISALKADEVVSEVIDIQKGILAEDHDFLQPIKSEVTKGLMLTREKEYLKVMKDFVSQADLDALPEKNRFDALMALGAKRVKEKLKGTGDPDDKDKKIEELSAELEKAQSDFQKFKEEEVPKINSQWEEKLTAREMSSLLRKAFEASGKGKEFVSDAELIYPGVRSLLESKFDIKYEDGKAVLYEKGKNTKALKNSKPLDLETAFHDIGEEKGAYKKSVEPPARPTHREQGTPEKKINLAGKDKFDEALKAKEAEATGV